MPQKIVLTSPCGTDSEARCHCGQLIAILKKEGVELKCKRCKRLVLIPYASFSLNDDSTFSFENGYQDKILKC